MFFQLAFIAVTYFIYECGAGFWFLDRQDAHPTNQIRLLYVEIILNSLESLYLQLKTWEKIRISIPKLDS